MKSRILLFLILFMGLAVRLVNLDAPMADLHSWRQADTAAVARNLIYNNFDLLHPRILNASSIDGMGRDNTPRYHFAEFPIYQALSATIGIMFSEMSFTKDFILEVARIFDFVITKLSFGMLRDFDQYLTRAPVIEIDNVVLAGRVVSISFSLISIWILYVLVDRYFSRRVALLSALLFALLPYSIFWSRTVLPDPMMLCFVLLTLLFFDVWMRENKNYAVWGFVFSLAVSLLMKPFILFMFLPMGYAAYKKIGKDILDLGILGGFLLLIIYMYNKVRVLHDLTCVAGQAFLCIPRSFFYIFPIIVSILFVWALYFYRESIWRQRNFIGIFGSAIIPFILWRIWMMQWPMSIPASNWLFNGGKIRFKPAWWHWVFQERLDKYMFNFSGLFLIGLSILFWKEIRLKLGKAVVYGKVSVLENNHWVVIEYLKKGLTKFTNRISTVEIRKTDLEPNYFWLWSFAACILYLIVFATGNIQHEYYQLVIVPFGSVLMAAGFWYGWSLSNDKISTILIRVFLILSIVISVVLGWYSVRNWYDIGNPLLVYIGQRANRLLPGDALVITDAGGNTTLQYYVNRPGWSVRDKQLEEMIDRGATVWISTMRDDYTNKLARLYEVIDQTSEYVILDLRIKQNTPEWDDIQRYEL